ncbi:winged helix-turn-helix transcriptional regulator [Streptomyces mobaraensis NBRC 13819 = DSM 40847]|uniref:Winged helix-turn-helix transcriptional regulator n=2 Tax=Streptomyces mobaraensis TaxID=35621 RepID=A0A5N5W1J6_STRMB|nr:winged helix-turn-helix domain-containing protein [Streptomyces mobaraensis]EME96725.1 ArsR family transcriptional regulator [Streptomyces mobaraensis NBRC 13819 = DSM 40847]KAB7834541.1 winged helix-turn-helix transcriptional regulator [Streptomyces mobaraensis]QTT72955.1 winged helix-turn-helix transcriptional regulator [Streptomyces mobaraensis NBRC 13819 = DSM 40847]
MIEFEFGTEDLAHTRFALSPLWEVMASVRVLKGVDEQGLHRPWVERVRPRIAAADVDFSPLFDLVPVPTRSPWSGCVPGFVCPPPATPLPSLRVELAMVRATPPAMLRTTGRVPAARLAALRADPARELGRLTDVIEAYWELALAPYWARVLTLLEDDIRYRAVRLVEGGTQHLFADLDPQITWAGGSLRLEHRSVHGPRRLDGRGLLLMPSAFVWPRVFSTMTDDAPQPALRYPPRGIGTLWHARPTTVSEALAGVVGRSRATLLAELAAPASTTDLARRTGLTPGGVSQHLTALRTAGLVSAHRMGRQVLYARTRAGETVVEAAGSGG